MIVDDEVGAVVGLAERACNVEHVAALVLRHRLLLFLFETRLAAAVKTFQKFWTIVYCQRLVAPAAILRYFHFLIGDLLPVDLEKRNEGKRLKR